MSTIHKVHKGALQQQNQQNTLKYLISQSVINPKAEKFQISSNIPLSELLKSIGNNSEKVLIKLKDNYYYGLVNQLQLNDENAVFIFHNGSYFQGSIQNGAFQGKGKLVQLGLDFKEKVFEYDGNWKNGKPHGNGYEMIQNSITYKGQFINGVKQGKGVMKYRDNSVYQGQFKNNQVEGYGTFKTQAHQWSGNWKQGYLEGEGEQISFGSKEEQQDSISGDSVYKGGFKQGKKNGMGTYTWGNNFSQYTGHFTDGQLDGEGRIKIGQAEYIGQWNKGIEKTLDPASKIQFKKVLKNSKIQQLNIKINE